MYSLTALTVDAITYSVYRILWLFLGRPRRPCSLAGVLREETGQCVACSRFCDRCGHPVRSAGNRLCTGTAAAGPSGSRPNSSARAAASRVTCGRAPADAGRARARFHPNSHRGCRERGQPLRHAGPGLCSACWQRHPERPSSAASASGTSSPIRPPGSRTSSRMSRPDSASPGPAASSPTWADSWTTSPPTRPRPCWSDPEGPDGRWGPFAREDFFTIRALCPAHRQGRTARRRSAQAPHRGRSRTAPTDCGRLRCLPHIGLKSAPCWHPPSQRPQPGNRQIALEGDQVVLADRPKVPLGHQTRGRRQRLESRVVAAGPLPDDLPVRPADLGPPLRHSGCQGDAHLLADENTRPDRTWSRTMRTCRSRRRGGR